MTRFLPIVLVVLMTRALGETDYPLTEDSKPQPNVPKGEILKFSFEASKIFPGTTREVTVYVPRQYDPAKPACVYVNQDGLQWKADVVFDNLIAKGEMPVTIAIGVMHGRVKSIHGNRALDRFNRSFEYDGLGPDYARFLLEELLPEVEKKTTQDGRAITLSKEPTDRAIGGSSSGAIAAFTAAWERPDSFSRVFSAIGTYVSLRGGDAYAGLIRKYEPKPIRVFLQDGSGDQNIYAGDWWMANQMMQRALAFSGYEHQHVWGDGGHNGKHSTAIFPDAMRYLWKGWPAPVKAGTSSNRMLSDILVPGEAWKQVWDAGKLLEGPAVNARGEVFFNDVPNSKTYRIALSGEVTEWNGSSNQADGQTFAPDGRLYAAVTGNKVVSYDVGGLGGILGARVAAEGFRARDLIALASGNIYATETPADGAKPGNLWLIRQSGEKVIVDTGLKSIGGLTASTDQSLLYVSDGGSHWVYSYQIQPDGSLRNKQRYYWLHTSDSADSSEAAGMEVDSDGRLYVATGLGLQVCDQAGRVNCILPTPNGKVSNVVFGGSEFDTLFVTAGDKIYKRKLKVKGAPSFAAPVKPKAPGL
ncbi:MAG TPA: SMP-30/gluconolactonase/LRE family protein [Chthoniobacteraceae bacterium]|jgi:sugar lactone lactonase YvrE/enterochelin esterase-like enzyme